MTPGWKTGTQTGTNTNLDLTRIGQAKSKIMHIKLNQVIYQYSCDYFFSGIRLCNRSNGC